MPNLNKTFLMGNITRDIEVKYTPGGTAVCEVGLAVNRSWFDKNANERKEEVTFVDCTLFGKQAELAGQYLAKGRPVFFEGRLKLDSWDDKQTGQKRSKMRVIVEEMQFLGTGKSSGGSRDEQRQSQSGEESQEPQFFQAGAEQPPSGTNDPVPF